MSRHERLRLAQEWFAAREALAEARRTERLRMLAFRFEQDPGGLMSGSVLLRAANELATRIAYERDTVGSPVRLAGDKTA